MPAASNRCLGHGVPALGPLPVQTVQGRVSGLCGASVCCSTAGRKQVEGVSLLRLCASLAISYPCHCRTSVA